MKFLYNHITLKIMFAVLIFFLNQMYISDEQLYMYTYNLWNFIHYSFILFLFCFFVISLGWGRLDDFFFFYFCLFFSQKE